MNCTAEMLRLYAVTDRAWVGRTDPAPAGGSRPEGRSHLCAAAGKRSGRRGHSGRGAGRSPPSANAYGVPFILNDNVALARQCGADGVHLGQEDMRRLPKPGASLARTGHHRRVGPQCGRSQKAAVEAGADYLGCGAMFPTAHQDECRRALPNRDAARPSAPAVPIPVVAIGGIHKQNLLSLAHCGEAGVALVSAIFAAKDIEAECRELRALVEQL